MQRSCRHGLQQERPQEGQAGLVFVRGPLASRLRHVRDLLQQTRTLCHTCSNDVDRRAGVDQGPAVPWGWLYGEQALQIVLQLSS